MADELSLLFRLKGENAQLKSTIAESRAAVAQLRESFGPQLTQSVTVANKAFSDIGDNLNNFVAQRVPLVGGAIVRITEGLRNAGGESAKTEKAIKGVAKSIESIATESGKSVPQIASFLTRFTQIEGQAKRDKAAVDFFGASLGTKLIPELEKTGTALAGVAAEGTATSSAIAGMAGPIGIAVIAVAALAAGAVIAAREIFQLTKRAAEFQGRMFDLAQQTGIEVETLSALEIVAKTTGGEIGSITQAIVNFQRKLEDAQDPLSKTSEQFRKFNVDTGDTENALRQTFAALAAMPTGFAQTNAAAEFFGARGGKQVLAILKETNGDLDGAIKRFRDLGLIISDDAARAADKLNDELAILEFQLRGLTAAAAQDLIPILTDVIRDTGKVLTTIRPLVSLLGTITATALRPAAEGFKGLSIIIRTLTGDYKAFAEAVKEANEAREINPLTVPPPAPVPLPGAPTPQQSASDAVNQAEVVVAAVKRKIAEQNQALDSLFQQGRRTREQQVLETIDLNRQQLKADQDRIDALLVQKEQELKALDEAQRKRGEIVNRDTDEFRAVTAQIVKLQQERLDKENEFNVTSKALRAKAAKERADATRNQIQNETDLLLGEFDRQIKDIEAQIDRGAAAEDTGLTIIEQLEQAKIEARLEGLKRQKDIGFLTIQEQEDLNNELQKLNQERDRLGDEQLARRLQREQSAAQQTREILISNLDTLVQLEQIAGQRRIDTIQALADARVITEEEAARRILQIRLDLLDDEITATQAKLDAAKSITDKNERIRTQAELNNQIKILTEQRKTIQSEGNREIDAGRQRDLENEQRYADELKKIKARVRDIERDAAEEVIRLMIARFARRKDIIRAQRDLELQEEADRHQRATDSINEQKSEVDQEIKTLERRLERLKIGTTEEIEEHERLIESLEKLRLKRAELEAQQDAEDKRSTTRKRRVTTESDRQEDDADPLGRLELDKERLKEFVSTVEESIIPLNQILTNSFFQVAEAIGSVVEQWVLYGETGPAVMRKILAVALASIAKEAAINAIKELALGFAMLFINPADSAAHFTSAALWGSIAGGAALAGRGVAGDLFKSKGVGAGAGAGSSSSSDRGQLNPLTLARNSGVGGQPQFAPQVQPDRKIVIEIRVNDSKFGKAITGHIVEDINNAGPIREVIGGDGNLNRG